ncbi:MAG TPA: DNA cytosine methyltransferase, partial [Bacteroidia bacterium]|nr:DNA cytosine methyltransferase [Bacteroidia bacterium]
DKRNNLVREMVRLVEVFRPKAILMENVPGLRSKTVFQGFVRALRKLGYTVPQPEIHDVVNYGVPQRRKRLVLAAGLGFEIPFARTAEKLKTVRETIKGLPKAGKSGDYWHDLPERRSDLMRRRIAATPKVGVAQRALVGLPHPNGRLQGHLRTDEVGRRGSDDHQRVLQSLERPLCPSGGKPEHHDPGSGVASNLSKGL